MAAPVEGRPWKEDHIFAGIVRLGGRLSLHDVTVYCLHGMEEKSWEVTEDAVETGSHAQGMWRGMDEGPRIRPKGFHDCGECVLCIRLCAFLI